jgi:cytochrome P450
MLEQDTEMHCGPGPDDLSLVPKGTIVVCPGYAQHRSKRLWGEDADEWKPERWEGFGDKESFGFNEERAGSPRHTATYSALNPQSLRFHPFTRAPRDCFGKNFVSPLHPLAVAFSAAVHPRAAC